MKSLATTSIVLWALLLAAPVFVAAVEPLTTYEQVVKKLEARFESAEAKPGQTVTLKIDFQLAKGWATYPTKQPEETAKLMANRIIFPKDSSIRFTGKVKEPENPAICDEALIDIKKLHYYPGGGTWECEAIVSPDAEPGPLKATVGFRVLVYNKDNCMFAPRRFNLEASLKVTDDPKSNAKRTPPVLKESITDKQGVVWMLNVDAALQKARKENKLVFIDLAAVTCTYWAIQAKNVIPHESVVTQLKEYVCVRLFIDSIPADHFKGLATLEDGENAAEANYEFMRKHGWSWPPQFAVIRPTKDGAFEKVSQFSERKIDDVKTFLEFLKKPLKGKH